MKDKRINMQGYNNIIIIFHIVKKLEEILNSLNRYMKEIEKTQIKFRGVKL
jgi:hypothetical protein